uniref:Secreted peptide n=1 Tax=Rhipicephalus pulchellus TaxID=72859 RepID=L7LV02_RHIPC
MSLFGFWFFLILVALCLNWWPSSHRPSHIFSQLSRINFDAEPLKLSQDLWCHGCEIFSVMHINPAVTPPY